MKEIKYSTDRTRDSSDNNEFATGVRDESLWMGDIAEEVPIDDTIPDGLNETGEDDRPIYDENGFESAPE